MANVLSEVERLYTPSEWSVRYPPEQLLDNFMKLADKATKEARTEIDCLLDVSYGPTDRSKYDLYGTHLPNDAPTFVFIHGGYWQELSKDIGGFPAPVLVSNGIKVIALGYDLCPNVKFKDIVSQVKSGIQDILKRAKRSGSLGVWISGHSAGAHLAASILHDEEWINQMLAKGYFQLVKGIVPIGGLYNLKPLLDVSANDALKLDSEEIETLSLSTTAPVPSQGVRNLKVLLVVGESDSPVFVKETREYAQKLIPVVDNVEYMLLRDNVDHFNIVENLMDPEFVLTKLILQLILCQTIGRCL